MAQAKHMGICTGSVGFSFTAILLVVLASATIAAAGSDTCAGSGAIIGGTCAPLTNAISGDNSNTALGAEALLNNTTGLVNTATGADALKSNTTGFQNTADGAGALISNTTGDANTAVGLDTLVGNTTGNANTGVGDAALDQNTTGADNVAIGGVALFHNTSGFGNTAVGDEALLNSTGTFNIGVGAGAGANLVTGDNNIDIGNQSAASESGTIRIGTQDTQTATFVAGIFGTPMSKSSASVVLIDSSGHLGVQVSSARYKRDIHDMGNASNGLQKLRPVSFRYKQDPAGSLQYGLIAEDVARVYPELVTRTDDGKIEGVRYDLLPALLVNEVQKLAKETRQKDAQIADLRKQIDALKKKDTQIDALAERMNALEHQARLAKPERLAAVAP
jgi:hypothetical protein